MTWVAPAMLLGGVVISTVMARTTNSGSGKARSCAESAVVNAWRHGQVGRHVRGRGRRMGAPPLEQLGRQHELTHRVDAGIPGLDLGHEQQVGQRFAVDRRGDVVGPRRGGSEGEGQGDGEQRRHVPEPRQRGIRFRFMAAIVRWNALTIIRARHQIRR